jgi:hypothetical protein
MLYDDSDLYDALLPASAAQLDYLNLARSCAGAVLALAWGSGQLIVPVAATGVSATGLDPSSKMLLAASRRAAFFSSVRCHLKPDGATNDYDRYSQVNRATWFISTAETRDAWVAPLHLRSIFPQELLALLAANGVNLMRREGDFVGGSFTSTSTNQVCQCRLA